MSKGVSQSRSPSIAVGNLPDCSFNLLPKEAIGLEAAIEQLQTFPGQVNFLVLEDKSELASFNADQPMAVGSTFKLTILAALRQQRLGIIQKLP